MNVLRDANMTTPAPGQTTLKGNSSSRPTLICLSHLRWNFVYQRPQPLMSGFARDFDVFFWEEPLDTEAAPYFALLAKIAKALGLSELSMGMSGDYEAAIMLGATQIRIGTALFGTRA